MKRLNLVRRVLTVVALAFLASSPTWGQIDEMYKDYREVYRDTVMSKPRTRILAQRAAAFPHALMRDCWMPAGL